MKYQVLLSVLATLVATTSTLFAQPGTGEDGPPLDPVPSQPVEPVGPTAPPPPQSAVTDPEPEPASTVATDATGIAVEVRIDTTQVLVDNDIALPGMAGGIFVGHRSRALTIGVGFDMTRLSESGGSGSSGQSLTSFLIIPGVRFVLARTADTRTELLGQVDAGYGQSIRGSDTTMGAPDRPNIHRFRFQAGPSLRQRNRVLVKRIATRFLEAVSWVLGHRERHPPPSLRLRGAGLGRSG